MGFNPYCFIIPDFTGNYLPEFSNKYLTMIKYLIIVFFPISLSIYYKNDDKNYNANLSFDRSK